LDRAPVPVTITTGHAVTLTADGWHVAKVELVGALQVLFQARRLKVAKGLPEVKTFVKELQNFRVKITAAVNEVFEAYREGMNDDLVLAVALAAWWAERFGNPSYIEAREVPPRGRDRGNFMRRLYGRDR